MIKSSVTLFAFFVVSANLAAQTFFSKALEGRVYGTNGDVAATHVLNTTTNKATITDVDGFFNIQASLNDTLVFSAIQFKKKEIVVSASIMQQKMLTVVLEDALTELDEVIVTPYNLSGDLAKDLQVLPTDAVVTVQTLGLPNAYVIVPTQAERQLFTATANPFMSFDPLINAITGRTKMLKERVAREKLSARTERVRAFYADSLFRVDLKIPAIKIDPLMYFCEADPMFQTVVDTHDKLRIWEFIRQKSVVFREENGLYMPVEEP